jgi:hypothetical protein
MGEHVADYINYLVEEDHEAYERQFANYIKVGYVLLFPLFWLLVSLIRWSRGYLCESCLLTREPMCPVFPISSLPISPKPFQHGVSGDDYQDLLEEVHTAIREDPTAAPKTEWEGDRTKYKRQGKVRRREGGKDRESSGWKKPVE